MIKKMKRTVQVVLAVIAGLGVQTASAQDYKVGNLTFALSEEHQEDNMGVTWNKAAEKYALSRIAHGFDCDAALEFKTKTSKIDTKRVIAAIQNALTAGGYTYVFSSKAKLYMVNYDNEYLLAPYPPTVAILSRDSEGDFVVDGVPFNGPRATSGDWAYDGGETIPEETGEGDYLSTGVAFLLQTPWPNNALIDWVNYDNVNEPSEGWPRGLVYVVDGTLCVDVSQFFAFEESVCMFCWDTSDRVTKGKITFGQQVTSGTCFLPQMTDCGFSGSGTTKFYLTIKFDNDAIDNWFLEELEDNVIIQNRLRFAVAGIVSYSWKQQAVGPVGTMNMSQANGWSSVPFCGVVKGSVKITETDNTKASISCYVSDVTD